MPIMSRITCPLSLRTQYEGTLRAYSHQAKLGTKAKKIQRQAKMDQKINDKHQRKFSLPFLTGVNEP